MRRGPGAATVVGMTSLTVSERRRLTAIRASWLFDGTGSALIANPLVVLDGAAIRSVESGGDVPDGAAVTAMAEAGRASLRAGVTTVRDLGDRGYLSLELRGREDQPTLAFAADLARQHGLVCYDPQLERLRP